MRGRGKAMEDGKLHFVQNLAKHPESGVYVYRFSFKGQVKTGSTGCYRLSEARDYVNALKGKFSLEGVGIKKRRVITFRQCYAAWLLEIGPQRTTNYVDGMKTMLGNHVLPIIGGFDISSIDKGSINAVLNRYLRDHETSGANTVLLMINSILGFALEKDWLKAKPKVKKLEFQRRPRPILSEEDLDRFLEKIDSYENLNLSFLVRVQIYMGMRNEESLYMKWDCVRMAQGLYIPDKTKNKDAPEMPIPDKMMPWFEKMAQVKNFGYICSRDDGKHFNKHYTNYWIHKAAKDLGFPDDLTNHRLRASFANLLNAKGVPLPTIQKLMRHARIDTTMIYIETRADELRNAVNKI